MDPVSVAILGTAAAGVVLPGSMFLYHRIRSHFPVTVNCHFCNTNTKVAFGERHCWDCPSCEQYNGFTEDGDYNKPIPAQFTEPLDLPTTAESGSPASNTSITAPSILCEKCSRNQLIKVRLLAHFVPHEEFNFEAEVDAYVSHLEHEYQLCRQCEHKVSRILNSQDDRLHRLLNETDLSASIRDRATSPLPQVRAVPSLPQPLAVRCLQWVNILLCVVVLWCAVDQMIGEEEEERYMRMLYHNHILHLTVAALGINILSVCLAGRERLRQCDAVSCVLWLGQFLLHSSTGFIKADSASLLQLESTMAALNLTATIFTALTPHYRRAPPPPITIQKRSPRRGVRLDTSDSQCVSDEQPPGPPPQPARSGLPGPPPQPARSGQDDRDIFKKPHPPTACHKGHPASSRRTPQLDELERLRIGTPVRERPPPTKGGYFFDFPVQSATRDIPNTSNPDMQQHAQQPRPIISPPRFIPFITPNRLIPVTPRASSLNTSPATSSSNNGVPPNTPHPAANDGPSSKSGCHTPVITSPTSPGLESGGHEWWTWLLCIIILLLILYLIFILHTTTHWPTLDFSTFLFS